MSDELRAFIYDQVEDGYALQVLQSDMAWIHLGAKRHGFYVWALRGEDSKLLVDQFKRDIKAWVIAAGEGCTIVMRMWPQMQPRFEGGFQLTARMLIVNQHPYYNSVEPSFMPKDGDTQVLGGTDDSS